MTGDERVRNDHSFQNQVYWKRNQVASLENETRINGTVVGRGGGRRRLASESLLRRRRPAPRVQTYISFPRSRLIYLVAIESVSGDSRVPTAYASRSISLDRPTVSTQSLRHNSLKIQYENFQKVSFIISRVRLEHALSGHDWDTIGSVPESCANLECVGVGVLPLKIKKKQPTDFRPVLLGLAGVRPLPRTRLLRPTSLFFEKKNSQAGTARVARDARVSRERRASRSRSGPTTRVQRTRSFGIRVCVHKVPHIERDEGVETRERERKRERDLERCSLSGLKKNETSISIRLYLFAGRLPAALVRGRGVRRFGDRRRRVGRVHRV